MMALMVISGEFRKRTEVGLNGGQPLCLLFQSTLISELISVTSKYMEIQTFITRMAGAVNRFGRRYEKVCKLDI